MIEQEGMAETDALSNEFAHGLTSLASDTVAGASLFAAGAGRHGSFDSP